MSSFFGSDENDAGGIDLSAADDKTLRLSLVPFTEEELAGLKRFQQTYLAHAESTPGPEALAAAHQEALKASGMPAKRVEQGLALLRLFGGKRYTVHRLRDKLQQLQSAGPEKAEVREKIQEELERLERETDLLGRRYGQEMVERLRRHEAELLALHNRLTQMTLNRT